MTKKLHNGNLDLVRILAVVMVFLVHLGQRFPVLGEWTAVGAWGVNLFFILSGYLINHSIEKCSSWKEYIKKRALRILPAYYVALGLIYLWDLVQYSWSWGLQAALTGPCHPVKFLRYVFFLQVIIPDPDSGLWCNRYALWTMSSFAVFYLLAYFLYKGVRRYWQSLLLLLVLMLLHDPMVEGLQNGLNQILPYVDGYYVHHAPWTRIEGFLFGTTLYYGLREKKEFSLVMFLSVILIMGQFTWYRFECVFTLLVLAAVKSAEWIRGEGIRKKIRGISEGSFVFYLCHLMLFSVLDYLQKLLPLPQAANIIFTIAFTVAVSWGVWRFLVKPAEAWLQKKWISI